MSTWHYIWESVFADPDDELNDFAGEIRPEPWDGRSLLPKGHCHVEAMGRLFDGTRIKLMVDRGDGSFDAVIYARPESYVSVIRRSEFKLDGKLFYPR